MQTPYELLSDLKKIQEMLKKGLISESEYRSQKKALLSNVLDNEKYYATYSCIEKAGELLKSKAITEDEFEKIKKQVLHDQNPKNRRSNSGGGLFAGIYAFFSAIGIFFDCVIIFGFLALCFVFPPLFILLFFGMIKWWWDTHWNYDNAVQEEIISKAIERNKD